MKQETLYKRYKKEIVTLARDFFTNEQTVKYFEEYFNKKYVEYLDKHDEPEVAIVNAYNRTQQHIVDMFDSKYM